MKTLWVTKIGRPSFGYNSSQELMASRVRRDGNVENRRNLSARIVARMTETDEEVGRENMRPHKNFDNSD